MIGPGGVRPGALGLPNPEPERRVCPEKTAAPPQSHPMGGPECGLSIDLTASLESGTRYAPW
jgi:hypothetical protein